MSTARIQITFEVIGSEPRVAAFLVWLEEGVPDAELDPVAQLAVQLGLVVHGCRVAASNVLLDDSRPPSTDDPVERAAQSTASG